MANRTERIGVNHCGEIAERNNWLFREQPVNDIGIDAHIEFVDASGKPKQLLAMQIKTGESWFKEQKDDCVIFRDIMADHYGYSYTDVHDMMWEACKNVRRLRGKVPLEHILAGYYTKNQIETILPTEEVDEEDF